ncbi:hypothetical protein NLJ89_g11582 [Agrocybe chaxingu]|uniref:Up-regulated during septation protein 1 domain-containing protein n=1 Tax=Agrocybe chaxingu TaxID=84603 RepID=A0A9W8JNG7_9AGAR|nr:hypothetical protein NLJ89_g11582 [Agrocybe chaxingu]
MTASLFLKKDRSRPPAADEDPSTSSVPYGSPGRQTANLSLSQGSYSNRSPTRSQTVPSSPASSSSPRSTTNRYSARKSVNTDPGWKRVSGNLNTRDELLMSLMASEAVIDSREYEILNGEDVDELKKEYQVLTSRLGALTKKLALETKIRDAALSLSKVNASHKKVSKQTSEQLDAANRRVDSAQTELWKVSDRVNEVNRRLMEHRAGVLGFQVRNMEKKMSSSTEDSSESNRSTLMSPALSSMTSVSSSSKGRFDGAHLFAGHADAIVPKAKLSAEAAAAEITALEEKLKAAKDQLTESGKKQAEMTRELSLMRLEKQEVETVMGMDLQAAEETIAALEKEIPRLEELNEEVQTLRKEKSAWEEEREELEERGRQVEILQARLMDSEARTGEAAGGAERMLSELREKTAKQLSEKDAELARLKAERDAERAEWEQERQQIEDERMEDLARLQEEMERTREEDETAVAEANQELSTGLATLQSMVKTHGIVLFSRDSSLKGLLDAIGTHIETVHGKLDGHARAEAEWEMARRKLEDDVRAGLDHYSDVIDYHLQAGVEPIVTLFHWDTPLALHAYYGGFMAPESVDDFVHYAKTVFKACNGRVKAWFTFNEPRGFCGFFGSNQFTFGAILPPPLNVSSAPFHCIYNILRAHAGAVKAFREMGIEGEISFKSENFIGPPWRANSTEDAEASERRTAFQIGIFADPVFKTGDWPKILTDTLSPEYLPRLTEEEKKDILGVSYLSRPSSAQD